MKRVEIGTVALIFAAGQSTRMGRQNKLLSNFNGATLIRSAVSAALESCCESVVVVTGHQANEVESELSGFDVKFVNNSQYRQGMASSIKAGIGSLIDSGCTNCVMLLADMPNISAAIIDNLIETSNNSANGSIVIATCSGRRGNPVLWPRQYFDELRLLSGDQGARQIFGKFQDQIIEVEIGAPARFDLDTPQAFETAKQ